MSISPSSGVVYCHIENLWFIYYYRDWKLRCYCRISNIDYMHSSETFCRKSFHCSIGHRIRLCPNRAIIGVYFQVCYVDVNKQYVNMCWKILFELTSGTCLILIAEKWSSFQNVNHRQSLWVTRTLAHQEKLFSLGVEEILFLYCYHI